MIQISPGRGTSCELAKFQNFNCDVPNLCECGNCTAVRSLSSSVNSGNINIDRFIKKTQISIKNPYLEWVPFKEFEDVKKIGQGGFSQVYKVSWKKISHINNGVINRSKSDAVLKILNNSQNADTKFIKELEHMFRFKNESNIIECFGVTQDPETKNYAFILEYARDGDLHHFLYKNFEKFTWNNKTSYLKNIVKGIKEIHEKKIIHRDLHSGNILVNNNAIISDLGFSQPATIDSRESQIYGIIPYMAPELFKYQPYSYASDIYSLGMIMWQLTSGHRPFHDKEHGPKLILDILDGKRPEITEDTPELWANLMKRCWHPDPSQRPTIQEIYERSLELREIHPYLESKNLIYYDIEDHLEKDRPCEHDFWLEFYKAEDKRLEMVESKKPFVKNPGYEHPNSRYYSRSLNSMLESIDSTISEDTPELWANLMKRCWHPDPSQRPTIQEIYERSLELREIHPYLESKNLIYYDIEDHLEKDRPCEHDFWLEFYKAEDKRLEMVESKKPFVKNPGYEHPNSRYYSRSLNSMLESIDSTISGLFSNNNLFSNDNFDIMDINFNQENNFEHSNCNSSVAKNPSKHLREEDKIENQRDSKRSRYEPLKNQPYLYASDRNYEGINSPFNDRETYIRYTPKMVEAF
ncbi:hypothetical protein Glove_346g21 [Diversispora epigaea]|uniref:Protein kinase domain-containing protein n=1 Tax=Diversispora epigaea TaxID=1348612 RepID=A0A397HMI1_9GLOM|nr:hypothetical protein Glove_346g21 [Diversispora epigaea]